MVGSGNSQKDKFANYTENFKIAVLSRTIRAKFMKALRVTKTNVSKSRILCNIC